MSAANLASARGIVHDIGSFAIGPHGARPCILICYLSANCLRTLCAWMNFLYFKLKEIPLWPPRTLVQANMPQQFKEKYPTTRVVLDATEVYMQKPHLPELLRMSFSNYKNSNTYKGLVGISPEGVITFVSLLFPGSISDKELTRQ